MSDTAAPQKREDLHLVSSAQAGDLCAQRDLIRRYQSLIHRVAERYRFTATDIDDLRQEGNIGFCKAIRHYDATRNSSFPTFATLCTRRQIIAALRAKNGDAAPLTEEGVATLADPALTPDARLLTDEAIADVRDAVAAGLSSREYRVLCAYLDGKPYQRMAAELGVTPKHIDNTLMKVRQKLERILAQRAVARDIVVTALQGLTAA
jgi:RNA polymerase sporulation-specific sigma factor